MIPTNIPKDKILFIDIETVRGASKIYQIGEKLAVAWNKVCETRYKEAMAKDEKITPSFLFTRDAALFPEFGKIVCISLGFFYNGEFRVNYYVGESEKILLDKVLTAITKASGTYKIICGHNIKQFDIPFIIRRATINRINLPTNFHLFGKKPWDLDSVFIDTREIWSSLAFNLGSCTLESIAAAFGIENPKDSMSGDMVSTYYYNTNDEDRLKKIGEYCNKDVIATALIYQMMTAGDYDFKLSEKQ